MTTAPPTMSRGRGVSTSPPLLESALHLLLLSALTLYAYRHILYSPSRLDGALGLGPPSDYPPWDILWDDKQNFVQNAHVTSGLRNWKWAWSSDAVIHGVYEPISLTIKMGLHHLARNALGVKLEEDARWYRVINLMGHLLNVWLVYCVGRAVLGSACDYRYLEGRIREEASREEKREREDEGRGRDDALNREDASRTVDAETKGGSGVRRRKRPDAQRKGSTSCAENGTDAENTAPSTYAGSALSRLRTLQSTQQYISSHRRASSRGCLLGAAVFAVHPLQVHTLGWSSCMSYFFASAFALLSADCWIRHRDGMRDANRRIVYADPSSENGAAIGAGEVKLGMLGVSTWQVLSAALYALASLCKAPAVVLPLVFVVVDVYLYSAPLSTFPSGGKILEEALTAASGGAGGVAPAAKVKKGKGRSKRGGGGSKITRPSPSSSALSSTGPIGSVLTLLRLAARSLPSHLPHLLALPPLLYLHVSGNQQTSAEARGIVPPGETYLRATWALGWYLVKLVLPIDLAGAVHYDSWALNERWDVVLAAVLVPAGTLGVVVRSLGSARGRVVGCALGCAVALLLPSLGIVQHARFVVADRYMYIPLAVAGSILGSLAGMWCTLSLPMSASSESTGCADYVMAGGGIPDCASGMKGVPVDASVVAFSAEKKLTSSFDGNDKGRSDDKRQTHAKWSRVAILAFFGTALFSATLSAIYLTPVNLRNWRNKELLWSNTVRIFPTSETAHTNLAFVYQAKGTSRDLNKAAYHARRAAEIAPLQPKYWENFVKVLNQRNEPDEIVAFLRDRLKKLPKDHYYAKSLHAYVGRALKRLGEWNEAERHLELAASMGDKGAKRELDLLRGKMGKEGAEERQRKLWTEQKERRDRERGN